MKPISPKQAAENFISSIDPLIIQAVNELLSENFSKHSITILEKEIVARYHKLVEVSGIKGMTTDEIYDKHQLDFEDIFRKGGWSVDHDQPGYCETYNANYTFKPKKV